MHGRRIVFNLLKFAIKQKLKLEYCSTNLNLSNLEIIPASNCFVALLKTNNVNAPDEHWP